MNKQEAIDALECYRRNMEHILGENDPQVKTIVTCIGLVDEVEDAQWIPVSERLPENPPTIFDIKEYLVCKDYGGMQVIAWCDGWNCTMDLNGVISRKNAINGVVAWMPLPEPYKEGKDE